MIPAPREVIREALTVIAGAVLAAWAIGQMPQVKAWIKKQWQ